MAAFHLQIEIENLTKSNATNCCSLICVRYYLVYGSDEGQHGSYTQIPLVQWHQIQQKESTALFIT